MMQFPPPHRHIADDVFSMLNKTTHLHRIRPCWPAAGAATSNNNNGNSTNSIGYSEVAKQNPLTSGSPNLGDANCMEQLLVHCATAIDNNDHTLTQQILWVLNNIASPDGDSTSRLTSAFLRSLISRSAPHAAPSTHRFSVLQLANFVDLTPWYRFGFSAANSAILHAVRGFPVVHIVDLSTTHCMQIPTLLDAIATRHPSDANPPPPPLVRLTVARPVEDIPPLIDCFSYDELGLKLVNFARSRNITLEFNLLHANASDGFSSLINYLRLHKQQRAIQGCEDEANEALVINCQMMLHYIPEESLTTATSLSPATSCSSYRSAFLKSLRSLNPTAVVVVEEDADFTSSGLIGRLRSAFNYLWIPFDTVDTFLPRGSEQRRWYEAEICWKVENLIAKEGRGRMERQEPRGRWVQRMRAAGFRGAALEEEAVAEVRGMLEEHAAGWGAKREDDDLVLTWKGHNCVFASAWLPNSADHLLIN
nr:GRAS transcription factor 23 [Rheum palmatum]